MAETGKRRAAFLDRDGVINEDRGYVHRMEDFVLLPGVADALRRLDAEGYLLIVVTNQSGIARGYFDHAAFERLSQAMVTLLAGQGAPIARIYHCPHLAEGSVAEFAIPCDCRKPLPGMILRGAAEFEVDLAASIMIGDKPSDVAAGRSAGVGRCFLVAPEGEAPGSVTPDGRFPSLSACVDAVLAAEA